MKNMILVTDLEDSYYSLYWYNGEKCYKTSILYFLESSFYQSQETLTQNHKFYSLEIIKGMDNFIGSLKEFTQEELMSLLPEEFL